ncbi:MAG: hypothetical protein B7Z55_11845 [Planctomycetales bacterium 12-60-4]|nr:MAG: hypothetical protein B7Z55_11845 [Planctomycetales bacterium 12-60-4]
MQEPQERFAACAPNGEETANPHQIRYPVRACDAGSPPDRRIQPQAPRELNAVLWKVGDIYQSEVAFLTSDAVRQALGRAPTYVGGTPLQEQPPSERLYRFSQPIFPGNIPRRIPRESCGRLDPAAMPRAVPWKIVRSWCSHTEPRLAAYWTGVRSQCSLF